jgi:hypothetical protein
MSKPTDPKSNPKGSSTQPTAPSSPSLPKTWEDIKVGSLVIAHESHEDGWWEAIVTSMTDTTLTLKWRDYPRQPIVTRKRDQVALLFPTS